MYMKRGIPLFIVLIFAISAYCAPLASTGDLDISTPIDNTVFGEADSGTLEIIGNWTHSSSNTVCYDDNIAYLSEGLYLQLIDVSDKYAPTFISEIWVGQTVYSIDVSDGIAYLGVGKYDFPSSSGGLLIVNVSDTIKPREIAYYPTTGAVMYLKHNDSLVYLAINEGSLEIVDVLDPQNPSFEGAFAVSGLNRGLSIYNGIAALADLYNGIRFVNVSDPSLPTEIVLYATPGASNGVFLYNESLTYAADQHGGLHSLNTTDFYNINILNTTNPDNSYYDVLVSDDYAYTCSGGGGLTIFDISDPTDMVEVFWGYGYNGRGVNHVDVDDGWLYLPDYRYGLYILSVADPPNAQELSIYTRPISTRSIAVKGDYAYIGHGPRGISVIDISNPMNPVRISKIDSGGAWTMYNTIEMMIVDDYLIIADGERDLRIVDISDPYNPYEAWHEEITSGVGYGLAISGNYAYLADQRLGLRIFDISNPTSASMVGELGLTSELNWGNDVDITGDYAYLIDGLTTLMIIDVSNPADPVNVRNETIPGEAKCIRIVDDLAYIGTTSNGVYILNTSTPLYPTFAGAYSAGDCMELEVEGSIAYLGTREGVSLLNVTNPSSPQLIAADPELAWLSSSFSQDVCISDGLFYIIPGSVGMWIYDHDVDGDGIKSSEESIFGTDSGLADSDGDTISDYDEIYVYSTNPTSRDSDNDSLDDNEELFIYSTDPNDFDSDDDTMPDGWEVENGLDPDNTTDALDDPDFDILLNIQEYAANTDPFNNDTDHDNLTDYQEVVTYGTNPLNSDSDFDTLDDWAEIFTYTTNPLSNDTDSDLMPDPWEIAYGLQPTNFTDAFDDPDGDLVINRDEYLGGTHPHYDEINPIIVDLDDCTVYHTIGGELVWNATDGNPHYYEVFDNETLVHWGWWNSSSEEFRYSLDNLAIGYHTIRITVCDINWNNATDELNVTILSESNEPLIDSPDDISYYYGFYGDTITWNTFDDNPSSYTVFRDGTPIESLDWGPSNWNITIEVWGYSIGTYIFVLELYDEDGHIVNDTVIVTVLEDVEPPSISSPPDFDIMWGSEGYNITWDVSDNNPCYYIIFKNNVVYLGGEWNSSMTQIAVGLDGLAGGVHNFTLLISDCIFNVTDSVYIGVLVYDDPFPQITSPGDIVSYYGSIGDLIMWHATDNNPNTYEIFRNGTLVKSGNWTSGEGISISLDGLSIGVFVFDIVVTDLEWQNATDQVLVFVIPNLLDIDSPEDFEYLYGTTGNVITWNVISGYPNTIEIYRNDSRIISSLWSGVSYTMNVDYLLLGNYNFTVVVRDEYGMSDVDTVWVSVVEELSTTNTNTASTTDTTNSTTDATNSTTEQPEWIGVFSFVITIGSTIVVVVVIIIIFRSRTSSDIGFEYS